jgi:hypothetical protein
MNLQNGYKVLYEKVADGKRTFFASKSGTFADAEQIGEAIEIGKYKLIYEKNGKIYCSESGVPADTDQPTEAFDKIFAEDAPTEDEPAEEEPEQEAHPEAIETNSDSHGKLTVKGNVVTLKATGTIEPATNPNGNTYHHVGFKITAPDGIDPANVVITRPDGKTRIMANILDGANYTNMYWKITEDERVFTYYIDWNNDGVYDLTVIIDATKATLGVKQEAEQATE